MSPAFYPTMNASSFSFKNIFHSLPTSTSSHCQCSRGSSLCCLCVRVGVRVYLVCPASVCGCEGVCVRWLGLGVTLACLLHTSCGISSLVSQAPPHHQTTKTQSTPTSSLARPPSPHPISPEKSMVFIRPRTSKGASSPPALRDVHWI